MNPDLQFPRRMGILYRAEKKRVLKSQLHLVNMVQKVLKEAEKALKQEKGEDVYR